MKPPLNPPLNPPLPPNPPLGTKGPLCCCCCWTTGATTVATGATSPSANGTAGTVTVAGAEGQFLAMWPKFPQA